MKIIVVGQYYYPDNFLINEITEELVKRGHNVTMLTGLPDYSTNVVPKEYRYLKKHKEIINGVKVIRVPIIARHKGFVFRVLNYLSFMFSSSIYVLTHSFNADVIMAYQTAPIFMVNAAIILKKKLKKPLFLYCLDIWPDQMKIWHVKEGNPIFSLVKKYCQFAYNKADILGITSKPFKKYMTEINNVDKNRIVYLPQHSSRLNIEKKYTNSGEVNLVFAGNIGYQQNIELIIKAVSKITTNKKYTIHIFGEGSNYINCINLSKKLGVDNKIKFYGRVSKSILDKYYSKMDAFLLTLQPESVIGFAANTLPAKFQGYLSAGKPILASIDGAAFEIINEIGCGKAVKANDLDGFAYIINDFIENKEIYIEYGKKGKEFFDNHFEKKVIMDQLEVILKKLSHKGEDIYDKKSSFN